MASVNLNSFIPEGCVEFFSEKGFIDAASFAAELLTKCGATGPGYPSEVVEIIRENGPYMVIAPGVAIVHGRPSDASAFAGISVVVSKKGLLSGHIKNDPVKLVFAISATSDDKHLEMLQLLSNFLLTENVVQKIDGCSTVGEVREIFSGNLS